VRPQVELELRDQFIASTVSFRLVAFKTLAVQPSSRSVPKRMFFSLKFYNFRESKTEQTLLRLPLKVAKNMAQQHTLQQNASGDKDESLLKDSQYFLMRFKGVKKVVTGSLLTKNKIEEEYEGLESGVSSSFDFDPSQHAIDEKTMKNQHESFCRYLDERAMTIDIWDGDSLMLFGQVRIPLYLLMRQGDPIKVVGQEFEVIESETSQKIGALQLVMTNQGRTIKLEDSKLKKDRQDQNPTAHNSRIEHSHPIKNEEIQETLAELVLQDKSKASLSLDEEMRKRKRVERLKQMGITSTLKPEIFQNAEASDWEKLQQLKQIQLIRAAHKANIVNKVSQNSQISVQRPIYVIAGEPQLFELAFQNPFDRKHTFRLEISDEDFKNGHIKKHELTIVDNSHSEWEHWVGEGKASGPSDWGVVRAAKNEIVLEARDSCNLLFKFQSFR
jgi:hypothetical protein